MTQNPSSHELGSGQISPSNQARKEDALLVEIAWEVANQVGGIYTVIRSKVPSMLKNWGDRYCAVGPYVHPNVSAIFEETEPEDNAYGRAVVKMREMGFEVHYGRWLTAGRPRVILLNPFTVYERLGEIKYLLWEHHHISMPGDDDLLNQVTAFGWLVKVLVSRLVEEEINKDPVIVHVHEWMAGTIIPEIRRDKLPVQTIFTTHATLLGRYLAMNDPEFYEHLPYYDWAKEAKHFNIEAQIQIERAAAHGAHIFSTVSELTAQECKYLIGREPEVLMPNGLNINRFTIQHELQIQHQRCKEEIHKFTMGHFYHSYHFDLDNTLYFFTSGRYEYRNKGYDMTLEALARLNWRMKEAGIDKTVVMFFITKQPFSSINPDVLHRRATLDKMHQTVNRIQEQIGDRLFDKLLETPETGFPDIRDFIDDNLKIKLRRNLQSWKSDGLPSIVTHNLYNDGKDDILNFMRSSNMLNHENDRVKIVYHPDFISGTSPLWGIEYGEFVRGCHLGIFPSYYEPWGYTPLECMASGVPAVTSDMAGFGDYLEQEVPNPESVGMYVVHRRNRSFDEAANQLTDYLFSFVQEDRKIRIKQRYKLEEGSELFDWENLTRHYERAYDLALAAR
ncbi:MAG: glycosyltransferase [Bacteroidota bacterium]